MNSPKPEALEVWPRHIPQALKEVEGWLLWRWWWNGKKWTKPPYNVDGVKIDAGCLDNWTDFSTALQAYQKSGFDGIGFSLDAMPDLAGVDLDHCVKGGAIEPWAQDIIDQLKGYAEISPSGEGVRIVGLGKLRRKGRKKANIEMYDSGRYLTLTGHRLDGSSADIVDIDAALDSVHRRIWPDSTVGSDSSYRGNEIGADLAERFQALCDEDPIFRERFNSPAAVGDRSDREFHLCARLWEEGFSESEIRILMDGSPQTKWRVRDDSYREQTTRKAISSAISSERDRRARANEPTFVKEDFGYYKKENVYTFSPTKAINSILERMDLCVTGFTRQDKDIYRYDGEIYRPDADSLIAVILRRTCGDYAQTRQINEVTNGVLAELKRRPLALTPDPFLMPLKNGVVDLRTGELRSYRAEDLFTFNYNASYDPEGGDWRLVLWQLCSTHPDPRDVLQAIDIATSVAFRVPFDVWVLLFGGGSNGKGNFEDMLAAFVGADRTSGMTLDELKASRFGPGALLDVDLMIVSEVEGVKGATTAIKKLATGEFLDSDVKFGGRKKGRPHLLTLLDANKAFDYGDDSFGRRRRTIKQDFPFQFGDGPDERPKDPLMKEKITSSEALNGLAHIITARAPYLIETRKIYQYKSSEQVEVEFNRQRFSLNHFVSECIGEVDYHSDQRRDAGFDRLRLDAAHNEYLEYCRRFNIPAPAAPQQLGTYISETFGVSSSSSSEKVLSEKTGKKEKKSFRYYEGLCIMRTAEEAYADHILRFTPSTTGITTIPQHRNSKINISEWCTTGTTDTTAIQLEEIVEEICRMYDFIKSCKSPREISWENYGENAVVPVVPVVQQQSTSISQLGSCGTSRGTEEESRGAPHDDPADEPGISDDDRQTIAEMLGEADRREAAYLNHVKTPEPKARPSEGEVAEALEIVKGLETQGRRVIFGNVEDFMEAKTGDYVEPRLIWRVLKVLELLGWFTDRDGAMSPPTVEVVS